MYFLNARYYDLQTGQFLTPDPIGFASGDVNPYRYVFNRPISSIDPAGLWRRIPGHPDYWWMTDISDTFQGLAAIANPRLRNRRKNSVCIRPLQRTVWDFPEPTGIGTVDATSQIARAWNEGVPHPCGVYDTGNLTDSWPLDGGDLLASVGSDMNLYIANASLFYEVPLRDSFLTPDQIKNKIMQQSGTGRTPLRSMTLIGHSWDNDVRIGGVRNIGGAQVGGWFELTSLVNGRTHELRNPPWPTWEDAIAGRFPPICWFRTGRGTTVRFVGCKTWKLAEYFALHLLRGDAVAFGTRKPTWAFSPGDPPNDTPYRLMGWGKGSDFAGWRPDTKAPLAYKPREYHAAGKDYWTEFKAGN